MDLAEVDVALLPQGRPDLSRLIGQRRDALVAQLSCVVLQPLLRLSRHSEFRISGRGRFGLTQPVRHFDRHRRPGVLAGLDQRRGLVAQRGVGPRYGGQGVPDVVGQRVTVLGNGGERGVRLPGGGQCGEFLTRTGWFGHGVDEFAYRVAGTPGRGAGLPQRPHGGLLLLQRGARPLRPVLVEGALPADGARLGAVPIVELQAGFQQSAAVDGQRIGIPDHVTFSGQGGAQFRARVGDVLAQRVPIRRPQAATPTEQPRLRR